MGLNKESKKYGAYQSSINGIAFSPSVAYRIGSKLSVGAGDGKVKFDDLDDWSAQVFFGLTFQITDNLMLGGLYRTKSDVDVEGDIKFRNIANPIENRSTSNLKKESR